MRAQAPPEEIASDKIGLSTRANPSCRSSCMRRDGKSGVVFRARALALARVRQSDLLSVSPLPSPLCRGEAVARIGCCLCACGLSFFALLCVLSCYLLRALGFLCSASAETCPGALFVSDIRPISWTESEKTRFEELEIANSSKAATSKAGLPSHKRHVYGQLILLTMKHYNYTVM